jgi:Tfp pilus assembly protein PilE
MLVSVSRRGVTLFQLLIIIAILALLLALFLPATVQLRIAAARAQSQNNLKQLALAFHNYTDAYQKFPPGANAEKFSAHAMLLPYIEQENLFRLLDFKKAPTDDANAVVRKARIKTYMSPLDDTSVMTESGPTNYFFSAGSQPALAKNDGLMFRESSLSFRDVTDGTSNTVLLGETLRGDGGVRAMTVARQHVALKEDALKAVKPETGVEEWKNDKNIAADRGSAWIEGRFLQTLFTATRSFNDEKPDVDCGGAGGLSALRTRIPVVQVGMADGSVRAVKVGIDLKTWQAACTRGGGEVIQLD